MANDVELSVKADVAQAKQGLSEVNAEVNKLESSGKSAGKGAEALDKAMASLNKTIAEGQQEADAAAQASGDLEATFGKTATTAGKVFIAVEAVSAILKVASTVITDYLAATGDAGDETRAWAKDLGDLADSAGSLDVIGTAAALGRLLANTWVDLTDGTLSVADANASLTASQREQVEALREQLKVAADLVAQHKEDVDSSERRAGALVRLIAQQKASGEVSKFVRDEAKKLLDEYDKIGEQAPTAFLKAVSGLGILSSAQEKALKDSERLADRAEKDAERRAKAEERAAERIQRALEANSEKLLAQIERYEEVAKRLDEINAKVDEATRTDIFGKPVNAANESVAELQKKVDTLRSEPIIDFVELARAEDQIKSLRLAQRGSFPGQAEGPDPNAKLLEEQATIQKLHDKEAEKLDKLYAERDRLTAATQATTAATAAGAAALESYGAKLDAVGNSADAAAARIAKVGDAAAPGGAGTQAGATPAAAAEQATPALGSLLDKQRELTIVGGGLEVQQGKLGGEIEKVAVQTDASVEAFDAYLTAFDETTRAIQQGIDTQKEFGDATGFVQADLVELADGTKYVTNTADRASDGFQKLGDVVTQTFKDGSAVMLTVGDQADAVATKAEGAADAVGSLGEAVSQAGKGDGESQPLQGLQEGLEKSKTGAADAAKATQDWIADLSTAEAIIDRIAAKLAGLQLGAE